MPSSQLAPQDRPPGSDGPTIRAASEAAIEDRTFLSQTPRPGSVDPPPQGGTSAVPDGSTTLSPGSATEDDAAADGLRAGVLRPTSASSAGSVGTDFLFMKPMPSRAAGEGSSFESVPAIGSPRALWQELIDPKGLPSHGEPLTLGHFRIDRLIGRGGMGAVFDALDMRLDRRVAIKVLSPEHSGTPVSVDRFRNEAKAAARLDHENIARVFFVGEDAGLHYIAFEFIAGENLRERIRASGRLPAAEAVRVGLQIAAALHHTSACGVVHRDVKPSNIILTPRGRAKLVDLGLARKHDPEASQDITVPGTTLGTFDYISPEQARDPRAVDIRSDIYSLGCTLYHALAGVPPYSEGTMMQKLLDHNNTDVPHVREANPKVSVELSDLVHRMMTPKPEARPQSAADLIRQLSAEAGRMGLAAGGQAGDGLVWTRPLRTPASFWQRHLGWIASTALLLLVAGALALPTGETDRPTPTVTVGEDANAPVAPPAEPPSTRRPAEPATADSEGNLATLVAAADAEPNGSSADPPTEPGDSSADRTPEPAITAADPTEAASAAGPESDPPPPIARPFVLDPGQPTERAFASLADAIRAVDDSATIEVLGDGPIGGVHTARLRGKRIRLRSPGVEIRPQLTLAASSETAGLAGGMVELSDGGRLEIYNIDLVIRPSGSLMPQPAFSLSGRASLRLSGVTVTQADRRRSPVPTRAAVGGAVPLWDEAGIEPLGSLVWLAEATSYERDDDPIPAELEIENSLVRGRLHAIDWDGRVGASVSIEQTGLAIVGSLLRSPESMSMSQRSADAELGLTLDHVTAMLPGPLVSLDAGGLERPVPVRVDASDSLFVAFDRGRPLLQTASETGYLAADVIDWAGARNRFDWDPTRAWQIVGRDEPISFTRWLDDAIGERSDVVVLRSVVGVDPTSPADLAGYAAAEFALTSGGDTRGTAADASDVGVSQSVLEGLTSPERP